MNFKEQSLVIRHSIREQIFDIKDSDRQLLTVQGIVFARNLGAELASFGDHFTLFHSPVARCRQTAEALKEGITMQQKTVTAIEEFNPLAASFNKNLDYISELLRTVGGRKYLQLWYENKLPAHDVTPIQEAAQDMFARITEQKTSGAKIFVTHDWNLFCLKSLFARSFEEIEIPGFLEGITIGESDKGISIFRPDDLLKKEA